MKRKEKKKKEKIYTMRIGVCFCNIFFKGIFPSFPLIYSSPSLTFSLAGKKD
jgi:hypothetical protein